MQSIWSAPTYIRPELSAESVIRGRSGPGRPLNWKDWESALANIENQSVKDFFEKELADGREAYLRKRTLRFRVQGKRRFNVSARKKLAYVWQIGRFRDDVEYWTKVIGETAEAKPVRQGRCLRLYLQNDKEFRSFENAYLKETETFRWTDGSGFDLDDDED